MDADLKGMLEITLRHMVDFPNEVIVKEIVSDQTLVYEVNVKKSDIGKVIGKQGANIKALRTVMIAAGAAIKKKVILMVNEAE